MTEIELISDLKDLRFTQKRIRALHSEIEELKESIITISRAREITITTKSNQSPIENSLIRIEKSVLRLALCAERDAEKSSLLYSKLDELSYEERECIIRMYIKREPIWRIANALYISERTVMRRKKIGIKKLLKKLQEVATN